GATVHVDLAVSEIFLQDDDHRGSLKDSLETLPGAVARAAGQTFVTRVIDAEVFSALLNQGLRPRLNVGGLEVPRSTDGANHFPQTREIGLAIGGARRVPAPSPGRSRPTPPPRGRRARRRPGRAAGPAPPAPARAR